ncbi:MAG TPA: hypothetical protein VHV50_10990 [Actinomycetota bacterium]|nr:hypothetical protein [Actinomycetota bacterium]
MTYMHDLEQKLHDWIESLAAGDISKEAFITLLKKSHLESFHNGQVAGQKPPVPSQSSQSGRPQWGVCHERTV